MSITELLTSHWAQRREAQAVYDIKKRLTSLYNRVPAELDAINTVMDSDAFDAVPEELVTEIEAIVGLIIRARTALDEHIEFLSWTPPSS